MWFELCLLFIFTSLCTSSFLTTNYTTVAIYASYTTVRATSSVESPTTNINTTTILAKETTDRMNFTISWFEFKNAFLTNGFDSPGMGNFHKFKKEAFRLGGIESKREAAMFLAQIIHESGGLRFKEEERCKLNITACMNDYKDTKHDVKGKLYYGRGYIQLTWSVNYLAASKDIFGDSRLLNTPEIVAKDDYLAWAVSFWYWKTRVRTHPGVLRGEFGSSTNRINGAIECLPVPTQTAINRFIIYTKVLKSFNITEKPNSFGCKSYLKSRPYFKIPFFD